MKLVVSLNIDKVRCLIALSSHPIHKHSNTHQPEAYTCYIVQMKAKLHIKTAVSSFLSPFLVLSPLYYNPLLQLKHKPIPALLRPHQTKNHSIVWNQYDPQSQQKQKARPAQGQLCQVRHQDATKGQEGKGLRQKYNPTLPGHRV